MIKTLPVLDEGPEERPRDRRVRVHHLQDRGHLPHADRLQRRASGGNAIKLFTAVSYDFS
jgi:hypothetical protein